MHFSYPITLNVIIFFSVIARTSAFILSLPITIGGSVPQKYKIAFILILSFILMSVLPSQWKNEITLKQLNLFNLTFLFISEFLLGLTIGLIVRIITEIFITAGFLIDRSMGFVMAQEIDPTMDMHNTLMSNMFLQLFLIMFLVTDSHLELIRIAAASFEIVKPGGFLLSGDLVKSIVSLSNEIFSIGLKIALPVFIVVIFINIGLGLMARVGQDFPVLMLSFPLRIGIGFLILLSILPIYITITKTLNSRLLDLITDLLYAAS